METKYSIKDLEHLSGVKAHTLRIWEQRYGFIKPQRTQTNIRYYCDEDLKMLLNAAVLLKSGMKISQVSKLSHEDLRSKVLEEAQYKGDLESQLNSLKLAMLDLDEDLFNRVLNASLVRVGAEETFSKLVAALIYDIGVLWQTNAISIAHEHFVTNLLKQKLFSTIDQLVVQKNAQQKTYVLYLPEDELHELGLLYIHYKFLKDGHRSVFFGQSLPWPFLKEICDKLQPDFFISFFTIHPATENINTYFSNVFELLGGAAPVFHLSGYQTREWDVPVDFQSKVVVHENIEQLLLTLKSAEADIKIS
jgi:DNA-binding transcriptional MerR regulator